VFYQRYDSGVSHFCSFHKSPSTNKGRITTPLSGWLRRVSQIRWGNKEQRSNIADPFFSLSDFQSPKNDRVGDTPACLEPAVQDATCNIGADTCPAPGLDPISNIMYYGLDFCLTEFTAGQRRRSLALMAKYRKAATPPATPAPAPSPTHAPTKGCFLDFFKERFFLRI